MHAYNYYVLTRHKFSIKDSFKGTFQFYLKKHIDGSPVKLDFLLFKRIEVKH